MMLSGLFIGLIASLSDVQLPHGFDEDTAPPALSEYMACILEYVSDGDTVIASCDNQHVRIRLLGIDAPEMGQKPWGERSKQALSNKLPNTFTLQAKGHDVYERVLGTLFDGKNDINLFMLRNGHAVVYDGEGVPPEYYQAEQEARVAKIGIWSQNGDQQNPRQWRRYHR